MICPSLTEAACCRGSCACKCPAEYKLFIQRSLVIGLDHQGAQTESALCLAGTADLGQSDRFQAGRGCMSQQSQHLHSAHHAGSRWIIAAPAIVNRLARVRLYARTRTVQGTHGSTE